MEHIILSAFVTCSFLPHAWLPTSHVSALKSMSVRVTVNGASTRSGSICAPVLAPLLFTLQEFRGRIDFLKRCNRKTKQERKQLVSGVQRQKHRDRPRHRLLLVFPFPCWWPRWPRWGSVNSWPWPCTPPALYPIVGTRRARSGASCCTSRWRCRSGWTGATEQPGMPKGEEKKQKINVKSCYWITYKQGREHVYKSALIWELTLKDTDKSWHGIHYSMCYTNMLGCW